MWCVPLWRTMWKANKHGSKFRSNKMRYNGSASRIGNAGFSPSSTRRHFSKTVMINCNSLTNSADTWTFSKSSYFLPLAPALYILQREFCIPILNLLEYFIQIGDIWLGAIELETWLETLGKESPSVVLMYYSFYKTQILLLT